MTPENIAKSDLVPDEEFKMESPAKPVAAAMQVGLKASITGNDKTFSGKKSVPVDNSGNGGDAEVEKVVDSWDDDKEPCKCSVCQRARDGMSMTVRRSITLEVLEWIGDLTAAVSRTFFTLFWILATTTHTLNSYSIKLSPLAALQGFCWQVSETFFIIASILYCYLSYLEWVSCDRMRFLYSFGIIYMMACTSNLLMKLQQERWSRTIKRGVETIVDIGLLYGYPNSNNSSSTQPT